MAISLEKEIVLGVIRQTIDFEFHGEKYPSIYPIFVSSARLDINLDSVINDYDSGSDLIEAIYEELLQNLEGVLDPKNLPVKAEPKEDAFSPTIEYAKAVSRNRIEIKFHTNISASKECLKDVEFDSGNPHICCQIIFREKPLFKGIESFSKYINVIKSFMKFR